MSDMGDDDIKKSTMPKNSAGREGVIVGRVVLTPREIGEAIIFMARAKLGHFAEDAAPGQWSADVIWDNLVSQVPLTVTITLWDHPVQ